MSEPTDRRPNALIHETSPYLLQHAHNPVDWMPWGEAAFERARSEDKPILLSVGYSACHWCHVMERESFENEAIAKLMNAHYVSLKVDREERPDVDAIYMNAVQIMTGSGGWPMTVFLTPDGKPFYGGTYFPPEDRYGRPGFSRVLESLHEAWTKRRSEVISSANDLTNHLQMDRLQAAPEIDPDLAANALGTLETNFDRTWGGFGGAPKFPNPGTLEFLLQHHQRTGSAKALEMLERTLTGMGAGGIYDQLGGGFARYSTDERWLAPHFEKMLYDNAQLARVYLHAYQVTGKAFYARIARETLDYVLLEMTSPEGGFYSAQDADSEGVEGKFYVWDLSEIERILGEDAALFARAFGVTAGGNWEGHTILTLTQDANQLAEAFGLEPDEVNRRLSAARARLYEVRSQRVWPGRDDKVLVSWNGLMLAAFAEGARVLKEARYLEAATANLAFVKRELYKDGHLRHTYKDTQAKIDGMLDDYALYALGALELYRTSFEQGALEFAIQLTRTALEHFRDPERGFFDTPDDGEALIVRPKSFFDSAMPSGNGAMAMLLTALGRLTGESGWEEIALEPIKAMSEVLHRQPTGFGSLLQALEAHHSPRREVAIIGDPERPETRALLETLHARFLPHVSLAAAKSGQAYLPVLEGRAEVGGQPAAYVCENLACKLPVTTPEALEAALD
jgi:uncharacterized protein YyaL (SSP411 family)